MKLDELYCALARGVLSNLSMADKVAGTIKKDHQPTVVLHANDALRQLYSRFNLRQKEIILRQEDGITFYHLRKAYSESGYDPLVGVQPYILDMNREPFQEDLIKLVDVFDSAGKPVPVNDNTNIHSIYTPQDKILQIPFPRTGMLLSLMYQAHHPELTCDEDNPVDIELPWMLHSALYAWIGYQIHTTIGTAESVAVGSQFQNQWLERCQFMEDQNAAQTSVTQTNVRFAKNGFI